MFVVMHLDVDSTPRAYGPFADGFQAAEKMAELVNEFLAEHITAGRPTIHDVFTEEPVTRDVVPAELIACPSDMTDLPEAAYRWDNSDDTISPHRMERFFVVRMRP